MLLVKGDTLWWESEAMHLVRGGELWCGEESLQAMKRCSDLLIPDMKLKIQLPDISTWKQHEALLVIVSKAKQQMLQW